MPPFSPRLGMPRRTRCLRAPCIALAVFVMLASFEFQLLAQAQGKERPVCPTFYRTISPTAERGSSGCGHLFLSSQR